MIVHDIVSAIIDDSSSQFLSLDGSSGHYVPLSRESAFVFTKNALNSKLVVAEAEKQKTCNSEASLLVSRYHKKRVLEKVEGQNNVLMNQLPMKVARYNTQWQLESGRLESIDTSCQ
jgi:hypothetical protein